MRRSRLGRLTLVLTLISPVVVGAQDPAPATGTDTTLNATASFPTDRFIPADTPVGFTLTRALGPSDGRLALVVGSMDVSALAEQSATSIAYRPRSVRLPRGESQAVLYLVNGGAWTEVARVPLKVLATGGFTAATAKPSAALTMKGQLAEGHSANAPEPERPTYQDFSVSGGLQSAHVRGGWTLRTQSNYLGVSRREEALRWGLRQNEAPRFDLSDYVVQIERGRTTVGLGHVSTGSNRHLMNEFASRGASVSVRGGVANLAVAALNGSSVVGWNNFAGLDNGNHRIYSATLGMELRPRRPGALHLDATVLDGSLLPQTSFTQGAVVDAERSTGTGVQLSASTPSQRLRAAVGYARSRFDNPIDRDTQLDSGVAVVPVRREASGAQYVELNAVLLQSATLANLFATTLNAGYRHERVDPLYRSVAASVQGDRLQHTGDLGGNIGVLSFQLSHGRGSDNLDRLASVLTTRTRTSAANATLPTAGLFRVRRHPARWPQLGYALMRTHQFGVGVPVDGDFSATHVPDQMSVVHDATAAWQGEKWRLHYRFNQSDQDNRQVGRERSDLAGTSHTASAGLTIRSNLDLSIDASDERQSNRELAQRTTVRRLGGTVNWRATALTTLTAFASTSVSSDAPSTSDADNSEVRFELARGFDLWRNPGGGGTRGQLFLRYASQSSSLHQRSLEAPVVPPIRTMRAAWTLSSGASLRVF
jgi:hypothetical protein